ncbi:MAG: SufD family Fe-S cluster assembly protein [Gammaproteobacteria bacterium]|nr:SufD family Fe-S cluster assembly protein [Gammaproteobacteria bacterium]
MAGSTTEGSAPPTAAPRSALAQRLLDIEPSGRSSWLDPAACQAVIARGLPDTRGEPWKYTNVNRWYDVAFTRQEPAALDIDAPDDILVVDFDDPRTRPLAAAHGGKAFDLAKQPLAAVNGLLLGGGVAIVVPGDWRGEAPIRIADGGPSYQHILLIVESGASITLIEEASGFTHRIVETVVETGGRLRHLRRQRPAPTRECSLVAVHLDQDARYELAQSCRGAELRRNDVVVTLAGTGARVTVNGAWRLVGREHLDNQVAINHVAPQGFSRQTFRGVVADRARAVLNGRIHIAAGAKATDAALNTKNLLATDNAEVYAKPELEIFESDVQCSHGATVGTLDEEAVFFLRTRGLSDEAARALLVRGFLREAVADDEGAARLELVA